jgi:hypothetical protein
MVALLEIEDIEAAIGRSAVDATEEAKWQFYIDAVSSFINGYVDVSFEELTDDVVRYQADYYGLIDLGGGPVSTVNSVKEWRSQLETVWDWDGIDQLFNLCPNQTVDVDYDHGYAAVPDDIKFLAAQVVIGVLQLGISGTVTSFTVGDVTEVYASQSGDDATAVLSRSVLNRYTNVYSTLRLGSGRHPNALPTFPTL